MKRRLIAAALVLIFPFGMAACGSQSKAAACHEIDNAAASASTQAQKNGQTTSRDPKVLRDRMADLTSTYKKASKPLHIPLRAALPCVSAPSAGPVAMPRASAETVGSENSAKAWLLTKNCSGERNS